MKYLLNDKLIELINNEFDGSQTAFVLLTKAHKQNISSYYTKKRVLGWEAFSNLMNDLEKEIHINVLNMDKLISIEFAEKLKKP